MIFGRHKQHRATNTTYQFYVNESVTC